MTENHDTDSTDASAAGSGKLLEGPQAVTVRVIRASVGNVPWADYCTASSILISEAPPSLRPRAGARRGRGRRDVSIGTARRLAARAAPARERRVSIQPSVERCRASSSMQPFFRCGKPDAELEDDRGHQTRRRTRRSESESAFSIIRPGNHAGQAHPQRESTYH